MDLALTKYQFAKQKSKIETKNASVEIIIAPIAIHLVALLFL